MDITLKVVFLVLMQTVILKGMVFDNVLNVINVQTPIGNIAGKLEAVKFDGKQYKVQKFLGIPFAEPPTGDKRFRKPVPKANFTHTLHAFEFGPSCLQRNSGNNLNSKMQYSEDCLFLNVFTPEHSNASSNIPVMVWIHGGWFQVGTSSSYNADVLSTFGDVIVVTLNYRLAHLGFLRIDEETGNFGLWDQHLAIKWVKDNIASFGGDVSNITIFGESAGSVGVVYQTLYAENKNLFHRAIGQSGSIDSPWGFATNETASKQFDGFASAMDCNGTRDQIINCFRTKSSNEIANVINSADLYSAVIPNRDRDFVPKHPQEMLEPTSDLRQSHDFFSSLDLLMGSTNLEGALYLFVYAHELNTSDIEHLTIPKDVYESYLVPKILGDVLDNSSAIPDVLKEVTVFEYTDWENPDDNNERLRKLLQLTTDTAVLAPTLSTIQMHSQRGRGNTYMYQFSVRSDARTAWAVLPSWLDGPEVAVHGDDVIFVFGVSDDLMQQYNISTESRRTSKALMTMWTNFAKTGDPNMPNNITSYLPTSWPQYQMTSQNYLDITPTMNSSSVKERIAAEKMEFWLHYLPSLAQLNVKNKI